MLRLSHAMRQGSSATNDALKRASFLFLVAPASWRHKSSCAVSVAEPTIAVVRTTDPDWAQSDDYASGAGRVANIDALHEQLAAWVVGFDDHELAEKLQSHGVAAAPVLCIGDLLDDPHFKSRGTYVEVTHPLGFKETIYGSYVKSNKFEAAVRPGPMIGQDNDYVFKELLELPEDRYRDLIEREIIY